MCIIIAFIRLIQPIKVMPKYKVSQNNMLNSRSPDVQRHQYYVQTGIGVLLYKLVVQVTSCVEHFIVLVKCY